MSLLFNMKFKVYTALLNNMCDGLFAWGNYFLESHLYNKPVKKSLTLKNKLINSLFFPQFLFQIIK